MNNKEFDQKIATGLTFTDTEIIEHFCGISANTDETFDDNLERICKKYDDGYGEILYVINGYIMRSVGFDTVYCAKSTNDDDDSIAANHIVDFFTEYTDVVDALAIFDLSRKIKDFIDVADESTNGYCKILVEPDYFAGTINAPLAHYLKDDKTCEPVIFENYNNAKKWIENKTDGAYCLSHGESNPPVYTITKA